MLRVFKMNECDWVASKSQQEAKEWYLKEMQVTEDDIDEPLKECNINKEGLIVPIEELTEEEMSLHKNFKKYGNNVFAWYSFADCLKEHNNEETYLICSTEC